LNNGFDSDWHLIATNNRFKHKSNSDVGKFKKDIFFTSHQTQTTQKKMHLIATTSFVGSYSLH
jgi:hypothetical protein